MGAEEASNGHALDAMDAGLAGDETLAILHAELADAYARLAAHEAVYHVNWLAIIARLAPEKRLSDLDYAAREVGLCITMRPRELDA